MFPTPFFNTQMRHRKYEYLFIQRVLGDVAECVIPASFRLAKSLRIYLFLIFLKSSPIQLPPYHIILAMSYNRQQGDFQEKRVDNDLTEQPTNSKKFYP